MPSINRRRLLAAAAIAPALALGTPAFAQGGDVTITHYFTGEFNLKEFDAQVAKFEAATGYTIKNSPIGHEDFKTDILVRAAETACPTCSATGARRPHAVRRRLRQPPSHRRDVEPRRTGRGGGQVGGRQRDDVQRQALPGAVQLPLCRHVLQHEGARGCRRHGDARHLGRISRTLRDAEGQGRHADRARLEESLARAVLVRLPAPAHRRCGVPRESHERFGSVRRRRSQGCDGDVEGAGRQGLLRAQRQCRLVDGCVGQGGSGGRGDDPDGHLDHQLLERTRPGGRHGLRLLPLPDNRRRRARGGRGTHRRAGGLQ